MRTFELDEEFAFIFVSYNSLLHLTPPEQLNCLRCVKRHLAPNGRLLIDLPNPLDIAGTPNDQFVTLEQQFTDPDSGDWIMQFASNQHHPAEQKLQITWWYDRMPANGGAIQRTVAPFTYYYLYPHEIEMMLQNAGIPLLALYGNYDQSPYTDSTPRLLVLAG